MSTPIEIIEDFVLLLTTADKTKCGSNFKNFTSLKLLGRQKTVIL